MTHTNQVNRPEASTGEHTHTGRADFCGDQSASEASGGSPKKATTTRFEHASRTPAKPSGAR